MRTGSAVEVVDSALRERFRRLEPLLDRALELEGEARERFVEECARAHPDLISHLRRALAAESTELPALGGLAEAATRAPSTGRHNLRVGPWRLLERLGRGGMGTVYRGERADGAFDKQVAIKLLRGQDQLRFREYLERERNLLARLDHPSIARLLDGGLLEDGQPWLVMELAAGEELHAWLRRNPPLERRLAVFLAICDAVGYAHAHLIVHRDLKPNNIRVDARDRVKLLDFGIAKLLDHEGTAAETRQLALTPEYAAPEQLAGGTMTTRTDIYALGALLYLLLCGRSPHPPFDGNWAAMVEAVCHGPRTPPSLAARAAPPPALPPRRLRGDLDAIVARALSRDPAARYPSAEALAEDVRRHRDARPVHARARHWRYRLACWMRRNRLAASLGGSAFVLATVLLLVLGWQAEVLLRERNAARAAAAHAAEALLAGARDALARGEAARACADAQSALRALDAAQARRELASSAERVRTDACAAAASPAAPPSTVPAAVP